MKKKIVVIYRLTLLWLPFLWLLAVVRRYDEVYFLATSNFYKSIERINKLEKYRIKWVKKKYGNYSDYARADSLAADFADKIYEKVTTSYIYIQINRLLGINGEAQEKKLGVVWKYYIYKFIKPFAEQINAAEFLQRTEPRNDIKIIAFNSFAYLLKGIDKDMIRINMTIMPGLYFYEGIQKTGRIVYDKINSIISGSRKDSGPSDQGVDDQPIASKNIDYDGTEVIYFPHQGIFFGENFTKDYYYCDAMDSPLHRSKIVHVSFYEKSKSYMKESHEYYAANDIPFVDLGDIGYEKAELYKRILRLTKQMNLKTIHDLFRFGVWIMLCAFVLFMKVEKYLLILERFKHLKVALAGYDYLFPRDLAMALTLRNVRICANEERLIIAFFPNSYLILDYYFVASDIVRESCLRSSQVDYFVPVGLVRVDNIYEYEKKQLYDEKYDEIKKTKQLVLALDYILPDDPITDINWAAAKVRETREFYKDLMQLAKDFPSLHIVIKGKALDSYKSSFIRDLLSEMESMENIAIEMDLTRYKSHFIAEKADFTIACYTSLCDELWAAGRKVIIYEINDCLDTLFDFKRYPLIAGNYNELKHHVENVLNGVYLDKESVKRIQEEFYSNCFHGNVRKDILGILEKIVHDWPDDKINRVSSKGRL